MRLLKFSFASAVLLVSFNALSDDCAILDANRIEWDDAYASSIWQTCMEDRYHPIAQFNIGWMYEHGRGVRRNSAEAAKTG